VRRPGQAARAGSVADGSLDPDPTTLRLPLIAAIPGAAPEESRRKSHSGEEERPDTDKRHPTMGGEEEPTKPDPRPLEAYATIARSCVLRPPSESAEPSSLFDIENPAFRASPLLGAR
jgi:hypothetical protein